MSAPIHRWAWPLACGLTWGLLLVDPAISAPAAHAKVDARSGPPEGVRSIPAQAWTHLLSLPGIDVQSSAKDRVQALVFFDPNCNSCAKLWRQLHGDQSGQRRLTTHWVPVAYVNASSARKAATIMAANSPAALQANFEKFDYQNKQGAANESPVPAKLETQLGVSYKIWKELGGATPAMVIKGRDGVVRVQLGIPKPAQLEAFIADQYSGTLETYRP